jgi:hypothetical protein
MPDSGIRGVVMIGPTCPVVLAGSPCPDQPWHGTVQGFNLAGALIRDTSTDENGAFELPLEPGTYDLVAARPNGLGNAERTRITVRADSYLRVTVRVDSGIR